MFYREGFNIYSHAKRENEFEFESGNQDKELLPFDF